MKNRELTGVYLGDYRVFGEEPGRRCVIGDVRLPDYSVVRVKGYADEFELQDEITYTFYGHTKSHPKYGDQFVFNSFTEEEPIDKDSLIAYMATAKAPERGSLTNRVAKRLVELYGLDAVDNLIADPVEAAKNITRWDAGKAAIAAEYLESQRNVQRSKIALIKLMDGRGFPKQTPKRAIDKWHMEAAGIIRRNPYRLTELPGIGFKGADKLYCDLARETSKTDEEYQEKLRSIERQGRAAHYAVSVQSRQEGSTWITAAFAHSAVIQTVGRANADCEAAIEWGVMNGLLKRDGGNLIATARNADHEQDIATFITDSDRSHLWPSTELIASMAPADKPLSDHQLTEIATALTSQIACLQGSPGVGKTHCVSAIVKAIIHLYGRDAIAVAAPTGKAGLRVEQCMRANDIDIEATTIHRMLVVTGSGDGGWTFRYCEQDPLPFRFIVIDESSMLNIDLFAALCRAMTPSTHLLLVGDTNQLAPVGHGKPFCDLQEVVPTGKLTEIRRNSGRIVKVCAEIRDHASITFSPKWDLENGENCVLIETRPEEMIDTVERVIAKLEHAGADTTDDIQVMTGKNNGSPAARKPLNQHLQQLLNPTGETIHGNPFRVGDKVVCMQNGRHRDEFNDSHEHFIANGELAIATKLQPGCMYLATDAPHRHVVVYHQPVSDDERDVADSETTQRGAVGDFDLGYAMTPHRAQGSQWPYAIVIVDPSAGIVQTRQWMTTAISRAEIGTIVIGQRKFINDALRRDGIKHRKTLLVESIRQRLPVELNLEELFA